MLYERRKEKDTGNTFINDSTSWQGVHIRESSKHTVRYEATVRHILFCSSPFSFVPRYYYNSLKYIIRTFSLRNKGLFQKISQLDSLTIVVYPKGKQLDAFTHVLCLIIAIAVKFQQHFLSSSIIINSILFKMLISGLKSSTGIFWYIYPPWKVWAKICLLKQIQKLLFCYIPNLKYFKSKRSKNTAGGRKWKVSQKIILTEKYFWTVLLVIKFCFT